MVLSFIGFLDGFTACCVLFFTATLGILMVIKGRRVKARLLVIAGLTIFFSGLIYLGQTVDLFSVLMTGNNIEPIYLYAYLCRIWVAPTVFFGFYGSLDLLISRGKKFIILFILILISLFEYFVWFDTNNSIIFNLQSPGQDIIDASFNRANPIYIIMLIIFVLGATFLSFGFMLKAYKSKGILRKKYLFLSIGYTVFLLCTGFDVLIPPGSVTIGIVRVFLMSFPLWMYLGLKEEHLKIDEIKPEKEIKLESDLFRISRLKQKGITEEDITLYKEKKICLVCKGKASGFNIYLCPNCDSLYCNKCAEALSELENACWVCNGPIDDSKPVKIMKSEEELEMKLEDPDKFKNKM